MNFCWLLEYPSKFSSLYIRDKDNAVFDPWDAMKFATKEEAWDFQRKYNLMAFSPIEHGFETGSLSLIDEVKRLKEKLQLAIKTLNGFENGWDCDTGANGSHPDYCRVCEAARVQDELLKA